MELAMKVSELTESERKVWQAAVSGSLVDLRLGDRDLDSPERWAEWGTERTVRAEVIVELLMGDGEAASLTVKGVRLQGARITGDLNLEASTLRCPLALVDCSFASAINIEEASAASVRLSGSHVPTLRARQLRTRGDLRLDDGFSVSGEVSLQGAHIGGQLNCTQGQFSNPNGPVLNADGLIVDQDMVCGERFSATSEVRLLGAHIGGQLNCTGGQFSNPGGRALTADWLTANNGLFCREGFSATGEVRLLNANIGRQLSCKGGQFSNPGGRALSTDGLTVDGNMICSEGFSATGEVRLLNAHIGGQLDCTGGQFSNPNGHAISASGLTVDGNMYCGERFSATGEVRLLNAHIGGRLDCTGGQFSNPGGSAITLQRATVTGPLLMASAMLDGMLDLTAAKTSSFHDDQASWSQKLRLDEFVYDTIEGASAKDRLEWLRQNESGYSPQIYEQLAAVYRRAGQDDEARRILIAKQRRRSAEGTLADKMWGWLLDWTVGYGYRTWQAVLWLAGLLALGTILFGYVYPGDLTAANKATAPPFQPFLYTLDLLLPVASLHQRDGWIAHGAAQWWSVFFIIMGWILATAVVLSLTGLLKRD
jgi:hypothetical protein